MVGGVKVSFPPQGFVPPPPPPIDGTGMGRMIRHPSGRRSTAKGAVLRQSAAQYGKVGGPGGCGAQKADGPKGIMVGHQHPPDKEGANLC